MFGLVGLGLNVLAFGTYLLLVDVLAVDPRISIGMVQVVLLPISYFAQKSLTFRSVSYSGMRIFVYVLGYLGSMAFQIANLYFFHTIMQFPHQFVAAAGLLLAAGGFYLIQRNLVFPEEYS